MELLKLIFNNAWIVGIGTGIITYILTSVITERLSKKGRIVRANKLLVNTLRGYVLNNGVPSELVFDALRNAIALECRVAPTELMNMRELCEALIAEIIGNTYIPTENQKDNVEKIENWIINNNSTGTDSGTDVIFSYKVSKLKTTTEFLTILLSIIATIISLLLPGFIQ